MKKFFAFVVSVFILCSSAACSAERADFEEIDASKLPSKIDLRNYEGKNYVTPVKTQFYGDCWAFSLAGAAETSYLFANDMGVPAGEINDKVDFSEKYITWYTFHGITRDDVLTGRVREAQVGEGFDPSEAEKENDIAVYIIGGEFIGRSNLFGAGFGPVDESVSVNGEYSYMYNDETSSGWNLPLNAEYRNAPVSGMLRNSIVLPSPTELDKDGKYSLNEDGLNAIKSELSKGHGVSLGVKSMHPGFNSKNNAAYYSGNDSPDHAVTVVGYDDDFSKDKFTLKNDDGEVIEGSTPPENGAFIIKNSWGLVNFDGGADDGYLYLSYYDHSITAALSYVFDNDGAVKYSSPNYDQYDLMMTNWYGSTDFEGETKTANVFDAEEDERLYQIAYTTSSPKTEVSYEIYKNVEDSNPSSGALLEKGVNCHSFGGYYKIDLKGEYELKKGEKYSIVLTMKCVTGENGEMMYTEVFPYSTEFFDGMTVRGVINKGESFLFSDGKWSDMTEIKDSLIETAFTQCAEEYGSKKTSNNLKIDSKDTFTVDNYPIKAILAPEK